MLRDRLSKGYDPKAVSFSFGKNINLSLKDYFLELPSFLCKIVFCLFLEEVFLLCVDQGMTRIDLRVFARFIVYKLYFLLQ